MTPRTGRPLKGNSKRDRRLEIRLTTEELDKIQSVADKNKLSKADTIVKAIDLLDEKTE
ncbi:CopG family transcriptional regulator [Aerococcaceae bacterium NML190938]|nr:CopG family transcriptional regulator [Aerococcaceae bacterium NML190938]